MFTNLSKSTFSAELFLTPWLKQWCLILFGELVFKNGPDLEKQKKVKQPLPGNAENERSPFSSNSESFGQIEFRYENPLSSTVNRLAT